MDTKLFEEKHKELLPIINTAWNMIDGADDVILQSWYEAIDYLLTNVSRPVQPEVSLPSQIENEEKEKLNQVILKQKTQLEIKDDMINALIITTKVLADKIKELEARSN